MGDVALFQEVARAKRRSPGTPRRQYVAQKVALLSVAPQLEPGLLTPFKSHHRPRPLRPLALF